MREGERGKMVVHKKPMTKLKAWLLMSGMTLDEFGRKLAKMSGRPCAYGSMTVSQWASSKPYTRHPSEEAAAAIEELTEGFVTSEDVREGEVFRMRFMAWPDEQEEQEERLLDKGGQE